MKQSRIQKCAKALLFASIFAFLMCILMAIFTAMIGENETLNLVISSSIQFGNKMSGNQVPMDKIDQVKPIAILGGILIVISIIGIMMAICAKLTMDKAIGKCCVGLEIVALLAISITLMVFGALLVIPAVHGTDYISDNCQYGQAGEFEKMDRYSREIFEPLVDFDNQYQVGVNQQMCSGICVCPGKPGDDHYDQYSKISMETYKKFNRTFDASKSADPLDIQAQMDEVQKQLQWLPATAENLKLTSETMNQCYDNQEKMILTMSKYMNSQTADKVKEDLKKAKPDPEFIELATHIESKYKCSGLCKKPLFYFTQAVAHGPPKDACLEPLIDDLAGSLENLGAVSLVTGIVFFFMIFMSIPLCCYNKNELKIELDEVEALRIQGEIDQIDKENIQLAMPEKGTENMTMNKMM